MGKQSLWRGAIHDKGACMEVLLDQKALAMKKLMVLFRSHFYDKTLFILFFLIGTVGDVQAAWCT